MTWSWWSFWVGVASAEFVTIGVWWIGIKIVEYYERQGILK